MSGSWAGTGLAGVGHHVLGNDSPITDISVAVTTFGGKSRVLGASSSEIRIAQYVGSYGIGCFADDAWACAPPVVSASWRINWEAQDFNMFPFGTIYGPSAWWNLAPGVVIEMGVNW